jgi:uncharacterized phosphosugar-binding protein
MLVQQYFAGMKAVLEKIELTQMEAIDKAAHLIVDSLLADGAWHIMDTGHMLMYEAIGRTGGLMAVRPVRVSVDIDNPIRRRPRAVSKKRVFMDAIEGLPQFVIEKSNMLPGDVLLVGSVSGTNILPVQMAIEARERGVVVVGLTAVEHSSGLEAKHPSGKRLLDVCDVVLDNCAAYGDTVVDVPELGQGLCPASGIAASYIIWALQSRVVELMLERGVKPHVYKCNHLPGAERFNALAWEEYEKAGY